MKGHEKKTSMREAGEETSSGQVWKDSSAGVRLKQDRRIVLGKITKTEREANNY